MCTSERVVIVTGASRGIGAASARHLACQGFKVVVNYNSHPGAAQDVVASIATDGGEATAVQADVADPASVATMFDTAEKAFGGVDVVVNCAGILKLGRLSEFDDEAFEQSIAVNLTGTFNVCREAAKRLRPGGRIINFSSSVIGMRLPTYGVYIATKAAVEGLTQVLAHEMRGRDISVNAIAPGPVATELFLQGKSPELIDHMAKMNPLERLGQPMDIVHIVSFLASPEGGWINGQILRANGGMC